MRFLSGLLAAVGTALAVACSSGDHELRSCDEGCDQASELCWFARNLCVPVPDATGNCPRGYVYAACGTGSCPACRDCVAACLPEEPSCQ